MEYQENILTIFFTYSLLIYVLFICYIIYLLKKDSDREHHKNIIKYQN